MSPQFKAILPPEQRSLRKLEALEVPLLRREYEGVTICVYLAKASEHGWVSSAMRNTVAHARHSYRTLYGPQVTVFDEHDSKAWIYVAIATYSCRGSTFDEVLTLRFVPAPGLPFGSDDLTCYFYKGAPGRSIAELLAGSRSPLKIARAMRGCYSQGRMGAIRPSAPDGTQLPGNRHVGLAWCAMLECFLEDSAKARRKCQILTSQTTEQLRILGAKIPTRPCDEHLGFERESIVLNRKEPHVRELCYGVPTYFLNMKDVSALIARLLREERLSPDFMQAVTTPGVALERALRQPSANTFRRLHLLFREHEPLGSEARMTGGDLRTLADHEVHDGPVLRLTQLDQLQEQLWELRQQATPMRAVSFIRTTRAQA